MAIKKSIKSCVFLLTLSAFLAGCNTNSTPPSGGNMEKDKRVLTNDEFTRLSLCGEDIYNNRIERKDNFKTDKTRYVGIFYSLWLGQHQYSQHGIYNITELEETEEGRVALASTTDNELSKIGDFHFWGEPLYGYYSTLDKFVLARHIELLTNAGIDYLCIDNTNDVVYYEPTFRLLDLLLEFQQQGINVPKVMFYTNSFSGNTVTKIYDKFYQTEKYNSIWFAPNGKPMIIGITRNNNNASDQTKYNPSFNTYISDEMCEFFDVKESEWPNGNFNENSIPWMSWEYPQYVHSGSVAVPVAQHSHSRIYVSSKDNECSRGYNNKTQTVDSDWKKGQSFQQMFDVATSNELVNNILVTSFNEWMAIKQPDATFVDVYNQEFSRDIEMMKGGYGDNFYLKLVQNVRNFKYTDYVEYEKTHYSIDISNGVSPIWGVIKNGYQDFENDARIRNEGGAVENLSYYDDSARNDIVLTKVVTSDEYVYFYIECAKDITPYNGKDKNYMNIFLRTNDEDPVFNGCNIVINREINAGKSSVEKCNGGYDFTKVGEADVRIDGNVMQVKVAKSLLSLAKDDSFEFKVCDNVTNYDDEMDYYVTGDVAPLGRLRYGF